MIYVVLDSPDRSIERIRLRVAKGGHHVKDDDVRRRYGRSLQQMKWFLSEADQAWIYDNSGAKPKQIAEKLDGVISVVEGALAIVLKTILAIEDRPQTGTGDLI